MSRKRIAMWLLVPVLFVAVIGYRMSVFREPDPMPAPRIAFVTGGSGAYWQLTVEGAKDAAGDHDVDLQIKMPSENENLEQQMAILGQLNLAALEGVALSPLDAEGQTDLINQLVRGGKKVMTFDADAPLSTRQSHIGTSNFAAGRICARIVNEAIPDGGKIAVLLANLTKDNMMDRKGGFQERIAQLADDVPEGSPLKFEVVGYFVDNGSSRKCEQNVRDVLTEHPDLACFVGMNASHGPILLRVLKDLDKLGNIKLVTFDDDEETIAGVEAGHIYATLAQDPYRFGYDAVATLASLCRGDEAGIPIVGRGSTYVSAEAIRQENLEEFRSRVKARQESLRLRSQGKKAA